MGTVPTKKIGDRNFAFGNIPATKALKIEVTAAKLLGPFIAYAQDPANKKGKATAKLLSEAASMQVSAIRELCAELDYDVLLDTMKIAFDACSCEGQPIDIDITFTGRPMDLWEVFVEAMKINFAPFFSAAISLFGQGDAKK